MVHIDWHFQHSCLVLESHIITDSFLLENFIASLVRLLLLLLLFHHFYLLFRLFYLNLRVLGLLQLFLLHRLRRWGDLDFHFILLCTWLFLCFVWVRNAFLLFGLLFHLAVSGNNRVEINSYIIHILLIFLLVWVFRNVVLFFLFFILRRLHLLIYFIFILSRLLCCQFFFLRLITRNSFNLLLGNILLVLSNLYIAELVLLIPMRNACALHIHILIRVLFEVHFFPLIQFLPSLLWLFL